MLKKNKTVTLIRGEDLDVKVFHLPLFQSLGHYFDMVISELTKQDSHIVVLEKEMKIYKSQLVIFKAKIKTGCGADNIVVIIK